MAAGPAQLAGPQGSVGPGNGGSLGLRALVVHSQLSCARRMRAGEEREGRRLPSWRGGRLAHQAREGGAARG